MRVFSCHTVLRVLNLLICAVQTLAGQSTTLIQSMGDFLPKAQVFAKTVSPILNYPPVNNDLSLNFGLYPELCAKLWGIVKGLLSKNAKPKHLLFGLHFLFVFSSTEVLASKFQVDEKTYRKWACIVSKAISNLDLVSYLFPFDHYKLVLGKVI